MSALGHVQVRYLEWLLPGMSTTSTTLTIPETIKDKAKAAFARYPVAMALQVGVRVYGCLGE